MQRRLPVLVVLVILAAVGITPPATAQASSIASPGTYTVQPGDTLSTIATRFGLSSWHALYAANRDRLPNPHQLRIGQVLVIPDATIAGTSSQVVAYLPLLVALGPSGAAIVEPPMPLPTPVPPSAAPDATGTAAGLPDPPPVKAVPPVQVRIPAIGLDVVPVPVGLDRVNRPIVPKHDVGWYTNSAMPGQGDNVVFWGHVSRWRDTPDQPAPFERLQEVRPGAEIMVASADGQEHRYVVTTMVQVRPHEVQYILPTGREQLTLVSCIGDRVILNGTRTRAFRLIVIATPVRLH